MKELTYIEAIAEAQKEEMCRDKSVFVIGEDVDLSGGVFKATAGLLEEFGAARVWGTPISEAAFTGLAAGAAATGLRPIVEFMYFDFITVAMDQVVNQIAKLPLMSGGQIRMPLTIRAQAGIGTCEAAQHSQSLEAWFLNVPGLKVVMPATVFDAKGLLKSAIRDDSPVIYIENRNLYYQKELVPEGEWEVPLGQADIVREGTDITVVAIGYARRTVLKAAELLSNRNISIEIIDPRTLHPLDMDTIIGSLRKTGKILVVHEAPERCGAGAEIIRQVNLKGFDFLDAPPLVLGGKPFPIPFNEQLEKYCFPQPEDVADMIINLAEYKI
jgi:pyruvate dehydrogenase E1 component beta subunit